MRLSCGESMPYVTQFFFFAASEVLGINFSLSCERSGIIQLSDFTGDLKEGSVSECKCEAENTLTPDSLFISGRQTSCSFYGSRTSCGFVGEIEQNESRIVNEKNEYLAER